jgi:hypothetical protein
MTPREVAALHLERGRKYRIRHRIQGVQRYDRESLLPYLWYNAQQQSWEFNARPAGFGTTGFSADSIVAIEPAPDGAKCYVNRRAAT